MVLLTASCGSKEPGTEVVNAGTVSVLTETDAFTGAAGGVGVDGSLTLVGGRCVGFGFGGRPTLIVFPKGTSVTGSGQDLIISVAGVHLRLGDHFSAGSRENESRSLSSYGDLDHQTPAACQTYKAMPVDEFVA
jgi:hypothetical protein